MHESTQNEARGAGDNIGDRVHLFPPSKTQVALVTHLGPFKSSSANSTLKVMVIRHILEAT